MLSGRRQFMQVRTAGRRSLHLDRQIFARLDAQEDDSP
jgi:hypothetical protein